MIWPQPETYDSWQEYAESLTSALATFEADNKEVRDVGQIGEFIRLPAGWLKADGSMISAKTHPALVALLGGTVSATLPTLSPQYNPAYVVGIRA